MITKHLRRWLVAGGIGALALAQGARGDGNTPDVVRVGHWLEVRGERGADGRFHASAAELVEPQRYEEVVGVAEGTPRDLRVVGLPVRVFGETDFEGIAPNRLPGRRIKVEGYFRDDGVLAAREVAPRSPGRERLLGRVDRLAVRDEGGVEVTIMRQAVVLPADLAIEHAMPIDRAPVGPPRFGARSLGGHGAVDTDDLFGDGVRLAPGLVLSGTAELRSTAETNFDLDRDDPEDREDLESGFRLRLDWRPDARWFAVAELRHSQRYRDDEEDGTDFRGEARLGEAYVYLRDVVAGGDLEIGRQDFDDRREWLYDQNLDGVRFVADRITWRLELSLSTSLSDARARDRAARNLIAYLSNGDRDRHLAAWLVARDIDGDAAEGVVAERPIHVGVRALGGWLPSHESWLEIAHLTGRPAGGSSASWGLDVGTSWFPAWAEPWSFTVGYAYGGRDFRQTGLQDNNGRLTGVTSFRYYGELVDPELANLHIATLGVGTRIWRETSLDLLVHHYAQDRAGAALADSEIDQRPTGASRDLGWEVDLVVGSRYFSWTDLELVGAWFRPGPAFEDRDAAFLAKLQARFRF